MLLSEVRTIFDAVVEKLPYISIRLSWNAQIVQDCNFEAAIDKMQDGIVKDLSELGLQAGNIFTVSSDIVFGDQNDKDLSLMECAFKRRTLGSLETPAGFVDLRFLFPTSNLCEIFFSKCRYTLSDRRRQLLPSNFEQNIL